MSDKIKESLSQLFENNIHIPSKTITLTGSVDDDMYETVLKGTIALETIQGPITIRMYLNSGGGDLVAARGIIDVIKNCTKNVEIICVGEVVSAATLILQAADHRVMMPNSRLMIHVGVEGVAENHPRNVDEMIRIHREDEIFIEDIYLKKIKEKKKRFTRHQLKSLLQFDKYLNPKEALELGLIDEIKE